MDNRAAGLIALVGAILLCGLPGLSALCCGAALWLASTSPETNFTGDMTPEMTRTFGIAGVCVGMLFVLIPLVIGFFTLRRKPDLPEVYWDEPIPPAI